MYSSKCSSFSSILIFYLLLLCFTDSFSVWDERDDHRYFFSEKFPEVSALPFHNASDYCETIGGHLTSSTSEAENEFLVLNKVQLYETCWIGLYIEEVGGATEGCDSCVSCSRERLLAESLNCDLCNSCRSSWQWKDGSAMNWWRWHHAQPDDGKTCGRIHGDGKWYDDDCGKELCFICKQSVNECMPTMDCGEKGFWNCRTKMCTCIHGYSGDTCEIPPTTILKTTTADTEDKTTKLPLTTSPTDITTETQITTSPAQVTTELQITTSPADITTETQITTSHADITTTEETTTFDDITTTAETTTRFSDLTSDVTIILSTEHTSPKITSMSISTVESHYNHTATHEKSMQWQIFGLDGWNAILLISLTALVGVIVFLVALLLCHKSRRCLYNDGASGTSSLLSFIQGSVKPDKSDGDQYINAYSEQMPSHDSFMSDKPQEDIGATHEDSMLVVVPQATATPYTVTDLCDPLCGCTKCRARRQKRPLFKTLSIPEEEEGGHFKSATLDGMKAAPKKPLRKFGRGLNYIQSGTTWEDANYFTKPVLAFHSHMQSGSSRPLRLPRYDDMRQQCYTDRSHTEDSITSVYDVPTRQPRKVRTPRNKRTDHHDLVHLSDNDSEERHSVPFEIHPNHRDLSYDSSILQDVYAAPLKTSTMEHSPPKKPSRKKDKSHQPKIDALKGEFDNSGIWYTTY